MAKFLDPDQELILKLSKKELKKRLNVTRSGLLDLLLQNQVLTVLEADDIRAASSKAQQVDILVDCLKEKTNQQFDDFCGALHSLGLSHIYQELLSDDVIHRHVEALQQKLCGYFTDEYSMVDMFAMHDEGHRVRMEEIYVPIRTVTYHQNPKEWEKRILGHYHEVFQQDCHFITVKAEPLGGKTTFVQKVCNDWAQANEQDYECLKKFKITLPIILRLVKEQTNLSQVLQYQLDFLTEEDLMVIAWLLTQEPERVLFLMDGLDEFAVSNSQEVFNIIRGYVYKESVVVITTRAEGMSKLRTKGPVRQMLDAQLEGFNDDHIKDYVGKYYSSSKLDGVDDSPNEGEELLSLIWKSKWTLEGISRTCM